MVISEHQRIVLFDVRIKEEGLVAPFAVLNEALPAMVPIILPHPYGRRWVAIPERFRNLDFPPALEICKDLFFPFVDSPC